MSALLIMDEMDSGCLDFPVRLTSLAMRLSNANGILTVRKVDLWLVVFIVKCNTSCNTFATGDMMFYC